jgi:bifunctional DNase/RNase
MYVDLQFGGGMAELIAVGVRAESWPEPPMILLKDPATDRYLPMPVDAPSAVGREQSAAGVSVDLVQQLLRALGAPIRFVEILEASAGPDRVALVVGDGVRVVAAPLEAIALALQLGLPIRCPDPVIEAEGVPIAATDHVGGIWTLAGATPVPGSGDGLDATGVLEAMPPAGDDAAVEPLVQPPAGATVLHIRQGPGAGAVFALDGELVGCGRDRGNQIVLDGATVSRKHAEFRRQGSRYVVCDLGSLNGTYVNGERVELAVLTTGDQIRIGRYLLSFADSS